MAEFLSGKQEQPRMPDIVLTTLNARYWHSSFGLRYLLANMGELTAQTTMLEFGIGDRTVDVLSTLLAQEPRIVGFGVYIWNIEPITKLVADLKQVRPDIVIVLGGPEVSYETEGQVIVQHADYVITGEADVEFPNLCRRLLSADGGAEPEGSGLTVLAKGDLESPGFRSSLAPTPATHTGNRNGNRNGKVAEIIHAAVPPLSEIALPYDLYNDEDIANRVIYVEVSRGCPFTCEFCLSALDIPVRLFDLDEFLAAMQSLLDRGVVQFKFVDRTFNLNMRVSNSILQFFLDRYQPGLFLHFEMIPDRLPDALRELIAKFPDGALQFEIGVQTFNDEVGELISRRQDNDKLAENFQFLREQTGVHIHADLIIGLPGETVESFAAGFDRLVALSPQEIQVGILKRLKGTPITRHDEEWQMVYSDHAPFEILSNRLLDFETVHQLRRFSRFWDLIANSGNFRESTPLIWGEESPFEHFLKFTDWIHQAEQRTHGIPLGRLSQRMFEFLTEQQAVPAESAAMSLWRDYVNGGRRDKPAYLKGFDLPPHHEISEANSELPDRQARHVAVSKNGD